MLEIFSSLWGLGSLIVAIILFLFWYFFCAREILTLSGEIKKFLAWLNTEREFQDIDAELKNYNRLLPVWKMFEKSLTKTNDVAYSTTDSADFFSPQNLTHGMNMTFWQAYGGIFTGLGILGTFAGLTYGLSGVDMTSGDIETLKNGIAKLLSGVESAFVTSLVGIFCAIVYSVAHHQLLKNFQGNVKSLAEKLDEVFPRRSAEDWLADSCRITSDQTNSIKEIGEAVTQAIYEGLDEKLGEAVEKLDPLVEKICEAIENLGAGGTDTVGEIFSDRVGAQMDRFSVALDKFTNSIDEKLKNANEISRIMSEQLLNTLKELNDSLTQQAKTSAEERNADYKIFSDTMETLIGNLTDVAEKIKNQQENTANDFEKLVKNLLDNFNAVMSQTTTNIQSEVEEANRKNHETSEQFLSTLSGLTNTLQEVAENSKQQQKTTADNFESTVSSLLEDLKNFAQQQKEYLNKTANTNATQISEAVKAFREIVDNHNETTQRTFVQIQKLLSRMEDLLQNIDAASTSLNQVAEPVRQSTLQLTRNLEETSAQMKNLSTANQTTRQNLFDLTARLSDFVKNFGGIADELERSTKIIHDSLDNYNFKTNMGLKEKLEAFDNSMNQAFSYLNELVEELSGVVEDSRQSRRR